MKYPDFGQGLQDISQQLMMWKMLQQMMNPQGQQQQQGQQGIPPQQWMPPGTQMPQFDPQMLMMIMQAMNRPPAGFQVGRRV